MGGGGDNEEEQPQRAVNVVSAVVSTVAAAFLGGGFYYGMTKQKKALEEEEKSLDRSKSSKKEFKPKNVTFFERKLALDRPLPPSTAASKALLGVTLVALAGCSVLVGGTAVALGVTNMNDLRQLLQKTPPSTKNIPDKNLDLEGAISDAMKQDELKGDK